MKRFMTLSLALVFVLVCFQPFGVVYADEIITRSYYSAADTSLSSAQPDFAGGTSSLLEVSFDNVSKKHISKAFFTFLANDPGGLIVSEAFLNLRISGFSADAGTVFKVYKINNRDWYKDGGEGSACYNNSRDLYDANEGMEPVVSYPVETASRNLSFNVTEAVAGDTSRFFTFCVVTESYETFQLASKEHSTQSYRPTLTITGVQGHEPVESVVLDTKSIELMNERDAAGILLTCTVSPYYAENSDVTWTSSDESVAKVNAEGRVTPASPGTAVIRVTSVSNPAVWDECEVTVYPLGGKGAVKTKKAPSDDAYVAPFAWPGNHGTDKVLPLRAASSQERYIYSKYRFPELAGAEVFSAKIYMYCNSSQNADAPVTVFGITGNYDWSELTLTEKNMPDSYQNASLINLSTTEIGEANQWYSWDVTDFVNNTNDFIYSFKFRVSYPNIDPWGNPHSDEVSFYSKEGSIAPYMEIVTAKQYDIESDEGTLTYKTSFLNIEDSNGLPISLISATYDGESGALKSVASAEYTMPYNQKQDAELSIDKPEGNDTVKFFVWDSLSGAKIYRDYAVYPYKEINDKVNYKNSNTTVKVDGNAVRITGQSSGSDKKSILVYRPGIPAWELTSDNAMQMLVWLDQKTTDEQGYYQFDFTMPEDAEYGTYKVVINDSSGNNEALIFGYWPREELTEQFLRDKMSAAKNLDEFYSIYQGYRETIEIDSFKSKWFAEEWGDVQYEILGMIYWGVKNTDKPLSYIIDDSVISYHLSSIKSISQLYEKRDIVYDYLDVLDLPEAIRAAAKANYPRLMRDIYKYSSSESTISFCDGIESLSVQVNKMASKYNDGIMNVRWYISGNYGGYNLSSWYQKYYTDPFSAGSGYSALAIFQTSWMDGLEIEKAEFNAYCTDISKETDVTVNGVFVPDGEYSHYPFPDNVEDYMDKSLEHTVTVGRTGKWYKWDLTEYINRKNTDYYTVVLTAENIGANDSVTFKPETLFIDLKVKSYTVKEMGDSVKFGTTYYNTNETGSIPATFMVSRFDKNGVLMDISIQNKTIDAKDSDSFELECELRENSGEFVKIMLWNGETPLRQSFVHWRGSLPN